MLLKWQKSQRLVGSSDPAWITQHILLDSLLFFPLLPHEARRVLDVGSGAGVPGIPLKIVRYETAFTLLEARAKRASFLTAVVRELNLSSCKVLNARLDAMARDAEGGYDAVVMRCAGDPTSLYTEVLPLLRAGGVIVATGPPRPARTDVGTWRQVRGPGPNRVRHFWIYHAP